MSLTRSTLALIALLSGLATALVVYAGTAGTSAQKDALAALRHPATVTAVQQGETLVAIAPSTTTIRPPANVNPPAADSAPAVSAAAPSAPAIATTTAATTTATTPTNVGLPKVGHVFVVSLSTRSFAAAFGTGTSTSTSATYLRSLLPKGTLLSGYRSLGHGELADQLALLSGQAPNPDTTAGCPKYVPFPAASLVAADGSVPGKGCVYPDTALTLADQVTNSGKQWGAYIEGMGTAACPTPQSNGAEDSPIPTADADYDTLHNPFIFFPSLTGSGACYLDEGDTTQLTSVLARAPAATPALTYLAPGACADGALPEVPSANTSATTTASATTPAATPVNPTTTAAETGTTATEMETTAPTTASPIPTSTASTTSAASTTSTAESATTAGRDDYCAAGQASGMAAADQFLATWVPQILASKAYRANGVLVIAFSGVTPKRGKRPYSTGALVISRWTPKDRRLTTAYQPYALLHSIEDMLDLQALAKSAGAPAFAKRILRTP